MELSGAGCRGGAEAVLNLQPNSSIPIAYHSLFGPHDDLVLLELEEKLLPDIFQERISLKGESDEDAVLCTQSKTYAIKFVGNSNSVFLVPPSDYLAPCDRDLEQLLVASVLKVSPGNMELVEVAPKLDKLKMLLLENVYASDSLSEMDELMDTGKNVKGLYNWEDLTARIQASDDELWSGLRALSAVEINGYWRIVDERYIDSVLSVFLQNLVLNDWSFDALNENEAVSLLESDGFPREIAFHCLELYCSRVGDDGGKGHMWRLDEKRVCLHFAKRIMRGGKKIKMESFMKEWEQKIPDGMRTTLEMLEGEVLIERLGIETWIRAFSVSSLPTNPSERFAALFRERTKWDWKDLQPYVRDLKVPGLSLEGLLLKYTRRTQPTVESEPVFSSR